MKAYVTPLLSLCLVLASGAVAQAQPGTNPSVTPWLNLYRGGGTPTMNYYNLVKPQFDFQAGLGQLQQQNRSDQQTLSNLQNANAPLTTGHQAGFMTQGSYFQTISGGGGAGFGTVGRAGGAGGRSGGAAPGH